MVVRCRPGPLRGAVICRHNGLSAGSSDPGVSFFHLTRTWWTERVDTAWIAAPGAAWCGSGLLHAWSDRV